MGGHSPVTARNGVTLVEKSGQKRRAPGRSSARDIRRESRALEWTSLDNWGRNSLATTPIGQLDNLKLRNVPGHILEHSCVIPRSLRNTPQHHTLYSLPRLALQEPARSAPLTSSFMTKSTGDPQPRRWPHSASHCGRQSHVTVPRNSRHPGQIVYEEAHR